MIKVMAIVHGIENYFRQPFLRADAGRASAERLLDYFPRDFLTVYLTSRIETVPQLRGMYAGDRSRKETLVELWLPHAIGAG